MKSKCLALKCVDIRNISRTLIPAAVGNGFPVFAVVAPALIKVVVDNRGDSIIVSISSSIITLAKSLDNPKLVAVLVSTTYCHVKSNVIVAIGSNHPFPTNLSFVYLHKARLA